jgi:hypothetical protein
MGETRKIAAIVIADVARLQPGSRGLRRIAHCRGCGGCAAI